MHRGFTLVEILVAMAVTLILLGIVVTIFGIVGDNVSNSRATIEMTDQLRAAKHKLQLDLQGVTTQMLPPRRPEWGEGYFEIIEGPVGRLPANTKLILDENGNLGPDTTVGDNDDILMFTTRSRGEAFVGRFTNPTSLQSQVAEVAWFLRGTTLYRRQLLVRPDLDYYNGTNVVPQPSGGTYGAPNFYAMCDLSVHAEGQGYDLSPPNPNPPPTIPPPFKVVANSLEDLTKRENRFAHRPLLAGTSPYGWPHDVRGWGWFYSSQPFPSYNASTNSTVSLAAGTPTVGRFGLPTLRECSSPSWYLPGTVDLIVGQQVALADPSGNGATSNSPGTEQFDAWDNPNPPWQTFIPAVGNPQTKGLVDVATGTLLSYFPNGNGSRIGEDIILTNVLSFDVRVWDPTAWVIADSLGHLYVPGDPGYPQAAYQYAKGNATLVSQGAYVDLYYSGAIAYYLATNSITLTGAQQTQLNTIISTFYDAGNSQSGLRAMDATNNPAPYLPTIYDTGSWSYEEDGIDQDPGVFTDANGWSIIDQGTNGLDDNGNGLVDEDLELEAPPPYSAPLRGVQIKIRCFEPDSRQIREVTIVQEFVPE